MYLKSIEVQGFKSFANKLKFEFPEGITGIVGPNGSGKSNVADAVRWVLGEQSARQLRSGSMQDVIFAGTETRKPLSCASVAITFDNSDHMLAVDYEEVTVMRRLYRSGESEYLLNNTVVRLRDINEIFYDTGIGQEGYSIIGQGQIERILSGKSDERRELFDEAAGIVKFKKRKAASIKKLDEEHANLLRVTDIKRELESRIGPLKSQSENAMAFLDKREKLKELDVLLFNLEDKTDQARESELDSKIEICRQEMADTREEFDRTRKDYDSIELELSHIDEEIEKLASSLSDNAVRRTELEGRIGLIEEQVRSLEEHSRDTESRSSRISEEARSRESDIDELKGVIAELKKTADKGNEILSESEGSLKKIEDELDELTHDNTRVREEMMDLLADRARMNADSQRYRTMAENLRARGEELKSQIAHLDEDLSRFESEEASGRAALESAEASLAELRSLMSGKSMRISEIDELLKHKTAELETGAEHFHRDTARLNALKSMSERYDGYGTGIRKIMERRDRNPGIRGVVAEIISVDKKYETAIETALGGSLRNIVTDNESTAKYLIEYLKNNRYGRVTFLPLSTIKPRMISDRRILQEKGVLGLGSDLVKAPSDEYEALIGHLLGRIVIVDNTDNAILIGRKYKHSHYMVTLTGELFTPGGAISGGAFKNTENLIGRKREIEELEVSVVELQSELASLRLEQSQLRNERSGLYTSLDADSAQAAEKELEINTLRIRTDQALTQLEAGRSDNERIRRESESIAEQLKELEAKSAEIKKSQSASTDREQELNQSADVNEKRASELADMRDKAAEEVGKHRLEAARLADQLTYRNEELKRLISEAEALKSETASLESGIAGNRTQIEAKKAEIEAVRAKMEENISEGERLTEERSSLISKKADLSAANGDFFDRREELSDKMSRLDKEYFHLGNQKEKLETAREERVSYMFDEYNLTPSEIRALDNGEIKTGDRTGIRKKVSVLKSEIKGLGSVNIDAIEEYKEVKERYEFLSGQYEDLRRSEETLTKIIAELDAGMRRQFTDKIEEIRREFDLAFKDLFGGGSGSIEIDPDADILEANISITAHPPGKKLQNMLQLSGGEKALTAIALLFAIQNLKPSPFCLLDEIEAALDESNVGRFADYLHKLTANTQFIIITHRRGTMTAADRLYGITMQEKGVSTMVSVNLIDNELS